MLFSITILKCHLPLVRLSLTKRKYWGDTFWLLHIVSISSISIFPIIGATKKALEELEKKRQKREVEEEDFKNRLERLLSRNNEIAKMREANTKLLADMKIKVKKARSKLSE